MPDNEKCLEVVVPQNISIVQPENKNIINFNKPIVSKQTIKNIHQRRQTRFGVGLGLQKQNTLKNPRKSIKSNLSDNSISSEREQNDSVDHNQSKNKAGKVHSLKIFNKSEISNNSIKLFPSHPVTSNKDKNGSQYTKLFPAKFSVITKSNFFGMNKKKTLFPVE